MTSSFQKVLTSSSNSVAHECALVLPHLRGEHRFVIANPKKCLGMSSRHVGQPHATSDDTSPTHLTFQRPTNVTGRWRSELSVFHGQRSTVALVLDGVQHFLEARKRIGRLIVRWSRTGFGRIGGIMRFVVRSTSLIFMNSS